MFTPFFFIGGEGCGLPRFRRSAWFCAAAFITTGAWGQTLLQNASLIGTDLAVMEAREVRKDLPCEAQSIKPQLGFDLKFHSGFDVTVPLRELAGSENLLTIIFRVTRTDAKAPEYFFSQRIKVPAIEENAKGDAYLQGGFDLGEGKYQVDWLMRDRAERVCASNWELEAALAPKDKQLQMSVAAGAVVATEREQFNEEPPIQRLNTEPLNVKVLINFAPQNSQASTLQPLDTAALVQILRSISREPRITKFTIVAFNVQEQKVLYRQDGADRIDFPSIGKALEGLQLGKVDVARLANKNADTEFLSGFIRDEIANAQRPDALIFAGPKVMLENPISPEVVRGSSEPDFPVFYMNYNLNPQAVPWRDSIGVAVKALRGTEYTISRPRDLWFAVTEMVQKIVKLRSGKSTQPSGSE